MAIQIDEEAKKLIEKKGQGEFTLDLVRART
ncbi:hypothetical protein ABB02_01921 [Clostridiaceae bacterium JG1575]|nr:hypothetical protein ABB02_01921 [Clostridiaceae bacterium JG1575]